MNNEQLETVALNAFKKIREKSEDVRLTIELCKNGFKIRIYKFKRDFSKPVEIPDATIIHLYEEKEMYKIFEELEEKMKKLID